MIFKHTQYERIFDTTRIPGKETDMLIHYEDVQKYVAVTRRVSLAPECRRILRLTVFA